MQNEQAQQQTYDSGHVVDVEIVVLQLPLLVL
jgi:hypothetical protein